MLEKAPHKFHDIHYHGTPPVAVGLFVTEPHLPIFNLDDAAVRDGHFKDIGREIFYAVGAGADGLAVDHPVLIPNLVRDVGIEIALSHFIPEPGLEDRGHGLDGQKEVDP